MGEEIRKEKNADVVMGRIEQEGSIEEGESREEALKRKGLGPECLPLLTLAELLSWSGAGHFEKEKCGNPLRTEFAANFHDFYRPKTLICHDLAGGYLEDRWVLSFPLVSTEL